MLTIRASFAWFSKLAIGWRRDIGNVNLKSKAAFFKFKCESRTCASHDTALRLICKLSKSRKLTRTSTYHTISTFEVFYAKGQDHQCFFVKCLRLNIPGNYFRLVTTKLRMQQPTNFYSCWKKILQSLATRRTIDLISPTSEKPECKSAFRFEKDYLPL